MQPKLSETNATEYVYSQVTVKQADQNVREVDKLVRLSRKQIVFAREPADEFKELCKENGPMHQVVDARMQDKSLSLRELLYPVQDAEKMSKSNLNSIKEKTSGESTFKVISEENELDESSFTSECFINSDKESDDGASN